MGFKRFVNLMEIVVVVVALGFVVMLFANEPDGAGGTADSSPGATTFSESCAGCHGAEGGGGVGPKLAGHVVDAFPDPADEIAVVTNGRRSMPSFDGTLTPEEIEQVVEYTRTGL
jgi:mono/diheme cytochrome c family protein